MFYGKLSKLIAEEGYKILKKMVWATIAEYQKNPTISHLPGSRGRFKLNPETLRVIEEQMEADDEITASQLLNTQGFSISRTIQSYKRGRFSNGPSTVADTFK